MARIEVKCPICESEQVIKYGQSSSGEQRYYCKNPDCTKTIFQIEYRNKGCEPGIEQKIIKMAVNASGIRDTSRVLEISTYKVMNTLKKQTHLQKKLTENILQTWMMPQTSKSNLCSIVALKASLTRCGVMLAAKPISDGCGWPYIMRAGLFSRTLLALGLMMCSENYRSCLLPSVSPNFILTIGVPTCDECE